MKITTLALSLLVGIGTGCTTVPPAPLVSMSDLPNCFDTNYDRERGLFTIKNLVGNQVSQQCLLTVEPRGDVLPELLGGIWDAITGSPRLTAGSYRAYLVDGGGGGAGGSLLGFAGGGGGGGGGAGAMEVQATVNLTEGVYKLTIGAGGPGGMAGESRRDGFGGGTGWAGSPSNMVRVATSEVVIGTPGADRYARPTRGHNERSAGKIDAHGGSGPGQTSGGGGADTETRGGVKVDVQAGRGQSQLASGGSGVAGAAGFDPVDKTRSGAGGGGGATSMGQGGTGGGEVTPQKNVKPENIAPERGSLGSGGGGGEGSSFKVDPGARGGHGYIALRPI